MRQFWFLFSIGIFAVGLGGCGSKPEEVATTPSPTTSPAASSAPNATPTPGQVPPFQNPVVKEQPNVAAGAGLIQSTNSQERLNLLGKRPTGTTVAPATTTAPPPSSIDPFTVLPPGIVQTTPDIGEAPTVPEQVTRTVPQLPKLPLAEAPLRWVSASATPRANNPGVTTSGIRVGGTPRRPVTTVTTGGNGATAPGTRVTIRGNGATTPGTRVAIRGNGATTPGTRVTIRGNGATTPGTRVTIRGNGATTTPKPLPFGPQRTVPTLPSLTTAQVPDLPALPNTPTPPSWRDPNPPPPPPPPRPRPVAAQPFVPPPPSTDLAQGMEVTGVLQVGDQTKIILKAPTEPSTRYVNVGQLVSNGQVLVKRVKFDPGGEPIVIFEQKWD
jgi:hypothetical protein